MPLEASIVKSITAAAQKRGAWVLKTQGDGKRSGTPDLLLCWRGRFIAFEVKQPGKTATRQQAANLNRLRRAGAVAAVVTSASDAMAVFDKIIDGPLSVHTLGRMSVA